MRATSAIAVFVALLLPQPSSSQDASLAYCAGGVSPRSCDALVEAMLITQARSGMAFTGGNPVPGASSTLGMKLGTVPRISLGGRVTGLKLELPPIEDIRRNDATDALITSFNVDASVGLYSGLSVLPTVAGLASIDLIASFGRLGLPEEDEFNESVTSWGIGARVGILRESFTAPGVSITGMYRGMSDIRFGGGQASGRGAYFELANPRLLSLRAVVGKRLLFIGTMAGVGYDRITSEASFGNDVPVFLTELQFQEDDFKTSRTSLFGGVQWTLLILSGVAEAGWQLGGDAFTAPLPAGQSSMTDNKAFFGSIALRLSI